MAVLEREKRNPIRIASFDGNPRISASPQKNANESATWMAPPAIATDRIFQRSLNENSRPMVKSSRIIPSSARFATCSCPVIREKPCGPTIAPVRMKATRGGTRIRLKIIPTTSATANTIRVSVSSPEIIGLSP